MNNTVRYRDLRKFLERKNFKPIKSVTNFICFKTGSAEASDYMFNKLLDEGVIIRPLKSNEMPEYVRVSLGTNEEMNHYYEAMEKILPAYDKKFGRPS
jgi:histidinol-phosphate aminotransferase